MTEPNKERIATRFTAICRACQQPINSPQHYTGAGFKRAHVTCPPKPKKD